MGKRTCPECGRDMTGYHCLAVVCSYDCQQERKKRRHRERLATDPEYAQHSRAIRRASFRKQMKTAKGRKLHRKKSSRCYWQDVKKWRAYNRQYYKTHRGKRPGRPLT